MALLPYTLLYILQIVVRQIISFQLSAQQSLRTPVRCRLCAAPAVVYASSPSVVVYASSPAVVYAPSPAVVGSYLV